MELMTLTRSLIQRSRSPLMTEKSCKRYSS